MIDVLYIDARAAKPITEGPEPRSARSSYAPTSGNPRAPIPGRVREPKGRRGSPARERWRARSMPATGALPRYRRIARSLRRSPLRRRPQRRKGGALAPFAVEIGGVEPAPECLAQARPLAVR